MARIPMPKRSGYGRSDEPRLKAYLRTQVVPWPVQRRFNRLHSRSSLLYDRLRSRVAWPPQRALSRPIFIVGSSRSGTTMLTRVLGAAPELRYFSENALVRHHMWNMVAQPASVHRLMPRLERSLVRLSGVASSDQRLLEKTPGHSLLVLDLAAYLKDAKFIHIVRDGRDCALSMLSHRWIKEELAGKHEVFWFRLLPRRFQAQWSELTLWQRGVLRWAVYVDSARALHRAHPDRYAEVQFERVCRAPAEQMRRLLSFLELDMGPDVAQRLEAIETASVARWPDAGLRPADLSFYELVLEAFDLKPLMAS